MGDTPRISGLVVAGSGPDPYRADVLATALHMAPVNEEVVFLSHATEVSAPTYDRFPALAHLDLEGVDYSSRETAEDTVDSLNDLWTVGDAIAVWDAPLALTTLAANTPAFDLPEHAVIYDLRVLDRALYPDRPGRRTLHTLADHLGLLGPDDSLEGDARLAATIATRLLPQVSHRLDGISVMDQQARWHRESMNGLHAWLQSQGRPTSHLDPSWPLRADSMSDDQRLAVVTRWAKGRDVHAAEAKHALRRLLGDGWRLTPP